MPANPGNESKLLFEGPELKVPERNNRTKVQARNTSETEAQIKHRKAKEMCMETQETIQLKKYLQKTSPSGTYWALLALGPINCPCLTNNNLATVLKSGQRHSV
jgi:hypothetical protein